MKKLDIAKPFSIVGLISIALLFQNFSGCDRGQVDFHSTSSTNDSARHIDRGGDGYPTEGKPEPGTYYRNIPGFTCAGVRRIYAVLTVTESTAVAKTIDQTNCSEVELELSWNELVTSKLNPKLLAHQDGGIYERLERPPEPAMPAAPIETWCQLRSRTDVILDAVTTRDPASDIRTSTMIGATFVGGSYQKSPTVVQEVTSTMTGTRLNYSGVAPSFSLDVLLGTDAVTTGNLKTSFESLAVNDVVRCFTGAQLDTVPISRTKILPSTTPSLTAAVGASSVSLNLHASMVQMDSSLYVLCVGFVDANFKRMEVHNCFNPPGNSDQVSGEQSFSVTAALLPNAPAGVYEMSVIYARWTGQGWLYADVDYGQGIVSSTVIDHGAVLGTLTIQ